MADREDPRPAPPFPRPTGALLVGAAAGLCAVALHLSGLLEPLERRSLDLRFALRGPKPPTHPIVLVALDETAAAGGGRPLSRSLHARLLDQIARDGPLAVALDFPLTGATDGGDDRRLGAAIARASRVVLQERLRPPDAGSAATPGPLRETAESPILAVRAGAAAVGFTEWAADPDGVVRWAALGRHHAGDVRLSLARRLFDLAAGPLGVGDSRTATRAEVGINYRGPRGTFPVVAYDQVVRGEAPPRTFAGRVVLVGRYALDPTERFASPFGPAAGPGGADATAAGDEAAISPLEIQASLLDTLLADDGIWRVSARSVLMSAGALALVGALLIAGLGPWWGLASAGVLAGSVWGLALLLFLRSAAWLDVTTPLLALLLGAGGAVVARAAQGLRRAARGRDRRGAP
jgi:adenylate cyclase